MRTIDADVLEERFADSYNGCAGECECCSHYIRDKWRKGWCGLIADAPTVGGWISVKDRLPEKSGTYLCYQPKAAYICALNTVRWSTQRGWMGKEVGSRIEGIEYWMPLPEPPKEEEQCPT